MPKPSTAVVKTEMPAGLFQAESAEQIVQDGWIRRKVDPAKANQAAIDQAEKDGDPRFDWMVSSACLSKNPDKRFIWAPQEDVRGMSGKQRGYSPCYGKDVELASGVAYADDELVEQDGCVLMWCDRARREAHEERERRTNLEQRRAILKRNAVDKIISPSGDGRSLAEATPIGAE